MEKKTVIPLDIIPPVYSEILEGEEGRYLQRNTAMFTFYKKTQGEHSEFFIKILEETKITGAKCTSCGQIICPPFMLRCPECNFADMEKIELPDTGEMVSSPSITYFANSRFLYEVPFGRGRVYLGDADTALSMHVYTTKGMLRPGVFTKGTKVKVVFRRERIGNLTDIFAVPVSELTPEQIAKSPLFEDELDYSSPKEPEFKVMDEYKGIYSELVGNLKQTCENVKKSPRAQKNLADWKRHMLVKTGGGNFYLTIDNGSLTFTNEADFKETEDFVIVCEDPKHLYEWVIDKCAITNLAIDGTMWISKNPEFMTIFKLDRLNRSIRRDLKF